MTNATFSNGDFRPIKTRKKKHEVQQETLAEVDTEEEEEETEGTASGRLFSCPNEGCVRVYTRYRSMVNHVTYGKCDFREERESVMDTAKVLYSKKLGSVTVVFQLQQTSIAIKQHQAVYTRTKKKAGH